ncbi:MAG: TolC family protein [Phycisphaerae bacterium]|nr:TolC family protein [Phycisphaerae bacterium]
MTPRPVLSGLFLSAFVLALSPVLLSGCSSPLRPDERTDDGSRLSPAVTSALEREIANLPTTPAVRPTESGASAVENTLAPRREELDRLGPQWMIGSGGLDIGPTLGGQDRQEVQLNLKSAIQRAVQNNLSVQASRIDLGISESRLAAAEAAFDFTLFADTSFDRNTQPLIGTVAGASVLNTVNNVRDWSLTTGIRKPLVTGATVDVSTSMSRTHRYPLSDYSPDPAWASAVSMGITQPLLRGFGSDVNMAQIRIAENTDRATFEDLRSSLLATVADVETAYWRLVLARQQVVAAQWLVSVGTEVRDVLERRQNFDATKAQYANAVATVEQRKASVLSAQRAVNEANNALKALMNDPDLPVGGDVAVVPIDVPVEVPVTQDLRAAIVTAADRSPNVAKALLGIDSASIGMIVADNGRLPQLDLEGRLSWFGLDGNFGDSYEEIGSGDFVDYLVGLKFSQAIGNRAAEATYREARLSRSKAVLAYRAAVQNAVLNVRNALQGVATSFELIRQNRAFRVAQSENLRALLVSEKTLGSLTPEFLQLKFQQQDTLARAHLQFVDALISYNVAISELHRAMGTGLEMNQIEIDVVDPNATDPVVVQGPRG